MAFLTCKRKDLCAELPARLGISVKFPYIACLKSKAVIAAIPQRSQLYKAPNSAPPISCIKAHSSIPPEFSLKANTVSV